MKHLVLVLAMAAGLAACSKQEPTTAADGAKPQAATSATAAAPAAVAASVETRQAAYVPNLKPTEIIWDSPEKKAAWEKRKAELKLRAADAQQVQHAAPAPVAEAPAAKK